VRPPTGKHDKAVKKTYAKESLTMMLWDIRGDDKVNGSGRCNSLLELKDNMDFQVRKLAEENWKTTTPSKSVVVLYHDIRDATSKYLAEMIDYIPESTKRITEETAKTAAQKAEEAKKIAIIATDNAEAKKRETSNLDPKNVKRFFDEAKNFGEKAKKAKEKEEATKGQIGTAVFSIP